MAVKISEKKQRQYDAILAAMRPDQEYVATYFCELLNVKISRTKVILKELMDLGKIDIVGSYRNRRYILKNNNEK